MAGPCIISYKGKDYSYEEFATMLHDGLLAQLVDDNVVTGLQAEQLSRGKRGEYAPRSFTARAIEKFPEIYNLISEEGMNYKRLPNSITLEEANSIVDYLGNDQALKEIKTLDNGMSWPVRFTIGQVLATKFRAEGEVEKMVDAVEEITDKATEFGQAIQALSMFKLLTPEGAIRYAVRKVKKLRKQKEAERQDLFTTASEDLEKVNKETVKKVIKKLKGEIDKTQEIKPKETAEDPKYGSTNKIVTKERYKDLKKSIKGKLFSNLPPELFEIATYHLEASGRQFAGFAKKMVGDFGNKVKPYLKSLYDKAKANLSNQYEDFEDIKDVNSQIEDVLSAAVEGTSMFRAFMKGEGVDLTDIVENHYTKYEAAKRSLTQKFIEDAGLEVDEAKKLARAIQAEFDRLATDKKKKIVDKLFTLKEKTVNYKKKRTTEEEIVRLSNLGVMSERDLIAKFGEKMDWPTLTEENIAELEKLAKKVQDAPEGFKRSKAVEDLMAYQANLKGVSKMEIATALFYANILSGPVTHMVNATANFASALGEMAVMAAQDPNSASLLASVYLKTIQRGLLEAYATLKTGYSPIRGKVETPDVLERTEFVGGFKNPASYSKYVRRSMVAADVIFFEAAKEMRLYQQAIKFAKENDIEPGKSAKERAAAVLGLNNESVGLARAQAELEYEAEVERINALDLNDAAKLALKADARLDAKRRAYEILEMNYPKQMVMGAQTYAARTTYNYPPEGMLGLVANGINYLTTIIPPLKFVVPFTNIIANVTNRSIDYSPWGFARYASGKGTVTGRFNAKAARKDWESLSIEQKKQEQADLVTKAIIGTAMMGAIYMLSNLGDDDDEPLLEITAAGTGQYAKNQPMKSKGYQEYSFKVRGTDLWISYKETPLFIPLSIIGTINDFEKYNEKSIDDPETQTKLAIIFNETKDIIFNSTSIASMNAFVKVATERNDESFVSKLQTAIANLAKGFVVPNVYTQIAREIEATMGIPMKEVKGTWLGPMLADIPFARDMYYNKVNVFGEEIIPDTDRFVSRVEKDKLIDLFIEKKYFPTVPSIKTETLIDYETNTERLMTGEEYYKYAKIRGAKLKEMMTDLYDEIKDLPKDQFDKVMKKIVSAANKTAKIEIND
jgi:hypothetical protein